MSALTPLLLRGLTDPARRLLVPRAQVHSKPPREQLGSMVRSRPRRAWEMPQALPGALSIAGSSSTGLGRSGGRKRGDGARATDGAQSVQP